MLSLINMFSQKSEHASFYLSYYLLTNPIKREKEPNVEHFSFLYFKCLLSLSADSSSLSLFSMNCFFPFFHSTIHKLSFKNSSFKILLLEEEREVS